MNKSPSDRRTVALLCSSLSSFLFCFPLHSHTFTATCALPMFACSACYILVSHWRWTFFSWLVVWGWAALKINEETDLFSFLALQICSPSSLPLDRDCFDLGNGVCMYAHPFICPGCIAAKSKDNTKSKENGKRKKNGSCVCARTLSFFLFFSFSHYDQVKIKIRSTLYRHQQISRMHHG